MARRSVVVERVYDHPGDEEAFRVFVDRQIGRAHV